MKYAFRILLLSCVACFADQSVTLAWDPNPEPDVVSYNVHYGTAPRSYQQVTNVGNVTTATVYGLKEGFTYYFAITARNTSGLESDLSNEVTNAIPANLTNRAPTIDTIEDVQIVQDQKLELPIGVWDVDTPTAQLITTATSTNQTLLPNSAVKVLGTNWNRTLSIEPVKGKSGQSLVTVIVSDGTKAASTSFLLTVFPKPLAPAFVKTVVIIMVSESRDGPWIPEVTLTGEPKSATNVWWRNWK